MNSNHPLDPPTTGSSENLGAEDATLHDGEVDPVSEDENGQEQASISSSPSRIVNTFASLAPFQHVNNITINDGESCDASFLIPSPLEGAAASRSSSGGILGGELSVLERSSQMTSRASLVLKIVDEVLEMLDASASGPSTRKQ
jgi:hypothetical protein